MAAVRVDPTLGISESAEFFGAEDEMLFGFRHLPELTPTAGVLVCSPLFAEFGKNYRREFELARRLAESGFAVQRFHYRGTGNSDGVAAGVTLDSLCADALAAAARLHEATGVQILAVVGTRLGCLVAAKTARELGTPGVVVWEPTYDPAAFLREALRARLLRDLREGATTAGSRDALLRQLEEEGQVDILGYTVHRALHRSLLEARLDAERPSDRILLLDRKGASSMKRASVLAARWGALGANVQLGIVDGGQPWWLATRDDEGAGEEAGVDEIVTRTCDWIAALHGETER